jgi:hypothetical protein
LRVRSIARGRFAYLLRCSTRNALSVSSVALPSTKILARSFIRSSFLFCGDKGQHGLCELLLSGFG